MRKIRGASDAYRFTPRGAWRLFLLYFDALKKARDLNDLAKMKQSESSFTSATWPGGVERIVESRVVRLGT